MWHSIFFLQNFSTAMHTTTADNSLFSYTLVQPYNWLIENFSMVLGPHILLTYMISMLHTHQILTILSYIKDCERQHCPCRQFTSKISRKLKGDCVKKIYTKQVNQIKVHYNEIRISFKVSELFNIEWIYLKLYFNTKIDLQVAILAAKQNFEKQRFL